MHCYGHATLKIRKSTSLASSGCWPSIGSSSVAHPISFRSKFALTFRCILSIYVLLTWPLLAWVLPWPRSPILDVFRVSPSR